MGKTLGIMFTISTYGVWLRGDIRGWVDDGKLIPADPLLEMQDRNRMKHTPFRFRRDQRHDVGEAIGRSIIERMHAQVWAMCVQSWHVHFLAGPMRYHVA